MIKPMGKYTFLVCMAGFGLILYGTFSKNCDLFATGCLIAGAGMGFYVGSPRMV